MTEDIPDPPTTSYNRNHIRLVPEQERAGEPDSGTSDDRPGVVTGFLGPEPDEQMEFHYEIRLVSGPRAVELALVQARALREVLEWFAAHTNTRPKTGHPPGHRDAA